MAVERDRGVQFSMFSLVIVMNICRGVHGYRNYTVGDSLGWYDNTEKPQVNYQKWAAGKNFSLGDFLIFHTDKSHSVVQTYNLTTYTNCDEDGDDTTQLSPSAPEFSQESVTAVAPLVKVGATYFFSGYDDGEQCKHGQRFMINVTYGQGLPKSLQSPYEAPGPAESGDDSSPDGVMNFNFSNPGDSGDDKPAMDAGQGLVWSGGWSLQVLCSILAVVLGLG